MFHMELSFGVNKKILSLKKLKKPKQSFVTSKDNRLKNAN